MLRHHDREKLIWDSQYEPFTKLLLLALNSFVDGNGECWPSVETLGKMTGMAERSVIRKIRELQKDQIVTSSDRLNKLGRQTSNRYRIDFLTLGVPQSHPSKSRGDRESIEGCHSVHPGVTESPLRGDRVSPDLSNDLSNRSIQREEEISLFSAPPENFVSEPPEPEQATPVIAEVVSDPSYEAVSVNDSLSIAKFEGSEPNVPGRDRQVNIAASGKIRPADTLADQFAGISSSDPQYLEFKGTYQRFVSLVGANYGTHAKAQQAWAAIEPEIDADFWDGLEAYIAQKQRQFAREGKAIGVKGAANWLLDREWQNALAAEAMQVAAKARGIDLDNPKSVKAAAKQVATQAAFAKWKANRQTEFPDAI